MYTRDVPYSLEHVQFAQNLHLIYLHPLLFSSPLHCSFCPHVSPPGNLCKQDDTYFSGFSPDSYDLSIYSYNLTVYSYTMIGRLKTIICFTKMRLLYTLLSYLGFLTQ